MKTATKVRDLYTFRGMAALYKLSEPMISEVDCSHEDEYEYEYVIVSAVDALFIEETYIFGASENGDIVDWLDLPGSTRGVYNHVIALNNAGYEVI